MADNGDSNHADDVNIIAERQPCQLQFVTIDEINKQTLGNPQNVKMQ